MRLQVYGGMAGDKLIFEFVQYHYLKNDRPAFDRFAVPGRSTATKEEIIAWSKQVGYKIIPKMDENDHIRKYEAMEDVV